MKDSRIEEYIGITVLLIMAATFPIWVRWLCQFIVTLEAVL